MQEEKTKSNKIAEAFNKIKNVKNGRNTVMSIVIGIIVVGYLIFFSSSVWMPALNSVIDATPLNSIISFDDREFSISRWDYSPNQKLMEIELNINNKALDGVDTYEYIFYERKAGKMNYEVVAESPDLVVLQIKNVPEKWREISMRIFVLQENSNVENDYKEKKLYMNNKEAAQVANIETLDINGYRIKNLNSSIDYYNSSIIELKESIADQKDDIAMYEEYIAGLQDKKAFQTMKEIEDTDKLINDASNNIKKCNDTIEDITNQIAEFNQKIEKATAQIAALS